MSRTHPDSWISEGGENPSSCKSEFELEKDFKIPQKFYTTPNRTKISRIVHGSVINNFSEETYQEKPIKVGEKIHERQEHQSAGNFRQICSTLQEIRFLLILNRFLCRFFFWFQDSKIELLALDSLKKDIGRGRYEFLKMELRCCRKLGSWPGKMTELKKFTEDGAGPGKFSNLSQMFLRSTRCSSKNLDHKGIRMKKIKILEGVWIQLENQKRKEFLKN